jgi:hypothetical protein
MPTKSNKIKRETPAPASNGGALTAQQIRELLHSDAGREWLATRGVTFEAGSDLERSYARARKYELETGQTVPDDEIRREAAALKRFRSKTNSQATPQTSKAYEATCAQAAKVDAKDDTALASVVTAYLARSSCRREDDATLVSYVASALSKAQPAAIPSFGRASALAKRAVRVALQRGLIYSDGTGKLALSDVKVDRIESEALGLEPVFSNPGQPTPPTDTQQTILQQLAGTALTAPRVKEQTSIPLPTVKENLRKLVKDGRVKHKNGLGYYRPDKPPPQP